MPKANRVPLAAAQASKDIAGSSLRRPGASPDTRTAECPRRAKMRRLPSRTTLSHFLRQPPLIRSKDGHRRSQFFLGTDPVPASAAAASVWSPLTEAVISGPSAGIVPRSTGDGPPWARPTQARYVKR